MTVGTIRSKGDNDEFRVLEQRYNALNADPTQRQRLRDFVARLRRGEATSQALAQTVFAGDQRLGITTLTLVDQRWYGLNGQAQWHRDALANPAEIQEVARTATIFYIERLLQNPASEIAIWGQCSHPRFLIEVAAAPDNEGDGEYITVDYYVPFNYPRNCTQADRVSPDPSSVGPGGIEVSTDSVSGREQFHWKRP